MPAQLTDKVYYQFKSKMPQIAKVSLKPAATYGKGSPRESSGETGERAGKVRFQDGSPRHPLLPYQSDAASFPEGEA